MVPGMMVLVHCMGLRPFHITRLGMIITEDVSSHLVMPVPFGMTSVCW